MLEKLSMSYKKADLVEKLIAHDGDKFKLDELNMLAIHELRSMYTKEFDEQSNTEVEIEEYEDEPVVEEPVRARADYPAIVTKDKLPAKFNLRMVYTADELMDVFTIPELSYIAIYYGVDIYIDGGASTKSKATLASEVATRHNQALFAQTGYKKQFSNNVTLPKYLANNPLLECVVSNAGSTFKINGLLTIIPRERETIVVSQLVLEELKLRGTTISGTPRILALDEYTNDLVDRFYRGKIAKQIKQDRTSGKY